MNLLEVGGFVAAFLGGVGGFLYGMRLADWVNRKLGRDAPPKKKEEEP